MHRLELELSNSAPMPLQAQFACEAGELLALVGPSGSGKTSLLRALAGLLPGSTLRGRVSLGERVWFDSARGINLTPQQRQVGLVFQSYALFPHLSVFDNVALAAGASLGPAQIAALLERLGLQGLQARRPAALSGGQQQRVALARALARVTTPGPRALLLDEPFSAVDAPTRQALYLELARTRQGLDMPMILVTHDLSEARRLADRVVILDAGASLQTGTPAHVFSSPRNARVAELVGIQNLFKGRFFKHSPGLGHLRWGQAGAGVELCVLDKNRLQDGVEVSWVLAGESIDLLPDAAHASGIGATVASANQAPINSLRCKVAQMLALGETSLCALEVQGLAQERITLNLSSALLRSLQVQAGGWIRLNFPPGAVHIMPARAIQERARA